MNKVVTLAISTVLELLRKKILNILLIFAVLIIASSLFFTQFSPGEESKIIKDICLGAIVFFGMLISIYTAGTLIPDEIDKKTIVTVLSKPVSRVQFLMGKFLGAALTVLLITFIMSLMTIAIVYLKDKVFDLNILSALVLTFIEMLVLVSISICVSTVASASFNLAFGFMIFIAGNLSGYLLHMAEDAKLVGVKIAMIMLNKMLPDFEKFNIRDAVIVGTDISSLYVFKTMQYGIMYTVIMLLFAFLLFNEREIN